ncbi:MAG: hypothetical protein CVU02_02625 [Bacteroidetes bacterium HGW-Bacteroidetes-19]|nr:MAG: hypothetical protein CVU04_01925 [Bacteroidetes bacterium HGW-Bacteroidetes-20]PKP27808.1 MAG: hypothetical protein CVU02_02625 [Bacteroidetes bacterium HGW-Bacteroidetes-19]
MSTIPMSKYAYRLIVFSVIMAAVSIVFQLAVPKYASPALPFIVLFFFLLSMFTLYIVLRETSSTDNKKMISRYLVSRIIKFVSCLLFLIIYILFNKEDRWPFGLAFMVIYFAYSIFEVVALNKEQKK